MSRRNQSSRSAEGRDRRGRRGRIIPGLRRLLLGTVATAVVALLAWMIWLDARITHQFEGRRWDQPAQVFAEPVELYVGLRLGIGEFIELLGAQGYREADGGTPRPG
jgi:penicillin-binding protein 1B